MADDDRPAPIDHRERPLEPRENASVRDILDMREFWRQARDLVTKLAIGITTVGAALVLVRDEFTNLLHHFFNGVPPT